MIAHAPTSAEIDAAVRASGEYDSLTQVVEGDVTGHRCAACNEFEPDYGDSNDGIKMIAVHSDDLVACSGCDCLVHRECMRDRGALCPHCLALRDDMADARALLAFCPDVSLVFALGQIAAAKRRATGVPE